MQFIQLLGLIHIIGSSKKQYLIWAINVLDVNTLGKYICTQPNFAA